MSVGIIGLGFVGLTTAIGMAHKGQTIHCYEKNIKKSEAIQNLNIPFYEPFLKSKLKEVINKKIFFESNIIDLVNKTDVIFICVGTPSKKNGSADLSFINNVILKLCDIELKTKKILCLKSTIPPGTIKKIVTNKKFKNVKSNFYLTFCPEFLREGFAWKDFINPDRIIVGVDTNHVKRKINRLFKNFNTSVHYTNIEEAELIKYLSNTLLATLISYSNEMSMIARGIGDLDIKRIFNLLHLDRRWMGSPAKMTSYVYPGIGFGGYCLPKDLKALIYTAKNLKVDPVVLNSIDKTNSKIKKFNLSLVKKFLKSKKNKIGIIGISFKEGSDDIRDTPALFYIKSLINNGYKNIYVYDELALVNFKNTYPNLKIKYCKNISEINKNCSKVIVLHKTKNIKNITKPILDLRFQI